MLCLHVKRPDASLDRIPQIQGHQHKAHLLPQSHLSNSGFPRRSLCLNFQSLFPPLDRISQIRFSKIFFSLFPKFSFLPWSIFQIQVSSKAPLVPIPKDLLSLLDRISQIQLSILKSTYHKDCMGNHSQDYPWEDDFKKLRPREEYGLGIHPCNHKISHKCSFLTQRCPQCSPMSSGTWKKAETRSKKRADKSSDETDATRSVCVKTFVILDTKKSGDFNIISAINYA